MIDTGSQVSIINAKKLPDDCKKTPQSLVLKGLGFKNTCNGSMVNLNMLFPNDKWQRTSFFAIEKFNMSLNISGINSSLAHFKQFGVPLSKNLPNFKNDSIQLDGIGQ